MSAPLGNTLAMAPAHGAPGRTPAGELRVSKDHADSAPNTLLGFRVLIQLHLSGRNADLIPEKDVTILCFLSFEALVGSQGNGRETWKPHVFSNRTNRYSTSGIALSNPFMNPSLYLGTCVPMSPLQNRFLFPSRICLQCRWVQGLSLDESLRKMTTPRLSEGIPL